MRLLNWLKKDSKSKRRQSAPPTGQGFDPNATRNPEYIRALEQFNEWRSQRLDSLGQNNSSGSKQTSTSTNTESEYSELRPMSRGGGGRQGSKAGNRLSLPAGTFCNNVESPQGQNSSSSGGKSSKTRSAKRAKNQLHETSIMEETLMEDEEIRRFEQQHCVSAVGGFELSGDEYSSSPPTRFYKKNAKPYHERLFAKTPTAMTPPEKSTVVVDIECTTPQRRNNAPSKPTRRKKSNAQSSGPIPKIRNSLNCSKSKGTETDSMSEPSHFNGSYKNYDINSSSMYDEYVISSKGYKGNLNKSSHTYQTVVNRHGDVVEYALPLVDEDKIIEPTTQAMPPTATKSNLSHGKDDSLLIDENFKFLTDKCNLNFSDSVRKFIFDEPSPNANKNLQVTDLDQSEMNEKDSYHNRREIFNELDALGRWAASIDPKSEQLEDKFNLNEFLFRNDTIIVSYPREVICRTSVLRNAIPMPVELTSGQFRNQKVSVRKHLNEAGKNEQYSQEALSRELCTLKKVRHPDIVLLMGVVADRPINQMQLILEPFDFSLNYYIHGQSKELSLSEVMIVMQQMAQAVNYLQECGHIHSNISSHSILMRQNPFCVKLGFFELATDINSKARHEILSIYSHMMDTSSGQDFNSMPDYSLLLRGSEKYAKEKYVKLSKNINLSKVNQSKYHAYPAIDVPSKYLPYYLEYRQQFSLYFYQPPELISAKSRFVLPNTFSDVYSLSLLLWELLNSCVPYVLYSYSELDKLYRTKQAMLPRIASERCARFEMILKMGLENDPVHRVMSIQDFVALLDDLKMSLPNVYDVVKKAEPVSAADLIEDMNDAAVAAPKERQNVNEVVIQPKLATKAPFAFRKDASPARNNIYENLTPDPQLRRENAITNNISLETFETKSTTTCADFSCAFSEATKDDQGGEGQQQEEEERRTVQRTNGELSGGLGKGYTPKAKRRNSLVGRKTIVKKPSPTRNKSTVKRSADNLFNLSHSTIFNSASDILKQESSPQQQFVAMERTSTLKRRKPVSRTGQHVANVFAPKPKTRLNLEEQLKEMDKGLNLSKEDLLEEFKNSPKHSVAEGEFQQKQQAQSAGPRVNPHKGMVARARAMYMKRLLYNNSNSRECGQGDQQPSTPNNRITTTTGICPQSAPAAYRSVQVAANRTPIAKNNQLLKHAWLSDQKLDDQPPKPQEFELSKSTDDILNRSFTIETQVADELRARNILSVEKVYRNPNSSSCNISLDESFKEKNVNVNLKIIHNNLEIFNNSMGSPGELSQKIQKIQLGMFEKEGCDSANIKKPEIKIRLTPGKNGGALALNDLNGNNETIGKQITDLTSEIRQRFENYECELWDKESKTKLVNELANQALESPKLIQESESRKLSQTDNEFRFETSLWHKEKSICEKTSNVPVGEGDEEEDADWISVPLAIKRFESISKSVTESPKSNNKSVGNVAEMSVVQLSRLPCGGAEGSPGPNKDLRESELGPAATSSPLVEDSIRRFNSYLKPVRLLNNNQPRPSLAGSQTQCCSNRSVVRRATFNDGNASVNRSDTSRRITTRVTLNLKKVQRIGSVNSSRTSEMGAAGGGGKNDSLMCANCGTNVHGYMGPGASQANLSASMISYSTLGRPSHDKTRGQLNRRSSSCSTLLKMDDLYIDDDFQDNNYMLTPNIDLVDNEYTNLYVD